MDQQVNIYVYSSLINMLTTTKYAVPLLTFKRMQQYSDQIDKFANDVNKILQAKIKLFYEDVANLESFKNFCEALNLKNNDRNYFYVDRSRIKVDAIVDWYITTYIEWSEFLELCDNKLKVINEELELKKQTKLAKQDKKTNKNIK
ncbi:hypothetical protein [Mycoplasma sp. 4423]